ncbi:MAG: GDSL family lipase [Sphingobium sp.]|nr:GDSL family lipase [Sphingobium sp.]
MKLQKYAMFWLLFAAATQLPGRSAAADVVEVIAAPIPPASTPLPLHVGGRVSPDPADPARLWRQWPGSYFETGFRGRSAFFSVGPGDAILHILVDGKTVSTLTRPAPGSYALKGLDAGRHRLRIEVASESGGGPTAFGGFFAPENSRSREPKPRKRQIEFIGDSHTVGYGNTSTTRTCTTDEVWATTDTSQAFAALLGRRYKADYRIHAISGRGIVRNYDGGGSAEDTMTAMYPYLLWDRKAVDPQTGWAPQLIVIALGTNDFSTALHAGEAWPDRDALHAAYEERYVRFVQDLRARNPQAHFILWATDAHDGEIAGEVRKVVDRLRALGETRVTFLPVTGLDFSACHSHPSLADDKRIAMLLRKAIGKAHGVWRKRDAAFEAIAGRERQP